MLSTFGILSGAGEGVGGVIPPPAAPPSNASVYFYGGDLVGVRWTNGDPLASTQIGRSVHSDGAGIEVLTTASPGTAAKETGSLSYYDADGNPLTVADRQTYFWYVRHIRGGVVTAWIGAIQ